MTRSSGSDARRGRNRRPRRALRRRGLVVAEGIRTEVQYVDAVKQILRESHTDSVGVKAVGIGRDPLAVLNEALTLMVRARSDGEPYDWCCLMVDVDDHAHLDTCVRRAKENGIHVVVSNPSFEIWLLWHLQDMSRHCNQRDIETRLRSLGHGGKNLRASFPFSDHDQAVKRAERADPALESRQPGPNPSSGMPILLRLMGAPDRRET